MKTPLTPLVFPMGMKCLLGFIVGYFAVLASTQADDYRWNNPPAGGGGVYSDVNSWEVFDTGSSTWIAATVVPGSGDTITAPATDGNDNLLFTSSPSVAAMDMNMSVAGWDLSSIASPRTLSIAGDFSKSGNQSLNFRSAGASPLSISIGGALNQSNGRLLLGDTSDIALLGALTVTGTTTVSGGNFHVHASNAVFGAVQMDGGDFAIYSANITGGSSGGVTIASLSGTGGTVAAKLSTGAEAANGTLAINGSSGSTTFDGVLADNAGSATTGTLLVTKTGNSTQVFTGENTYTGGTTITAGTLLINNASGSGTGSGAVDVDGGTLGGTGNIGGVTTLASGAKLAPGSSAAGTLSFSGAVASTLDISAAVGGANVGALLFELGAVGASDQILLTNSTGSLNIGTGVLNFDDFGFAALGGFGVGVYTLFDTDALILGSLGTSLDGTIGGFNGTLGFGDSNQDIILTVTVVPEPSAMALGLAGFLVLAGSRKARRISRL